jgi:septum formation protein
MASQPLLCLASSSPRRREILGALGLDFAVEPVDIDESRLAAETPRQMVLRLASSKACAAKVASWRYVIGADTAVILEGTVLGKPQHRDDAIAMLLALSGRTHTVLTGVALRGPDGVQTAISATEVGFREICRDEALAYWHSGEPRDKAGAYGIQGLGGMFVEAINGSYTGVVGLPVFETTCMLRNVGIDVLPERSKHDG